MANKQPDKRLCSVAEAAEYCGVHQMTIRKWISQNRITGYRIGPRLIKIDRNELEGIIQPIGGGAG